MKYSARPSIGFHSVMVLLATVVLAASVVWGEPPQVPVNVSPVDGASGVPADASLCVQIQDPDGEAMDVTFHTRDLSSLPEEDFTIILIPDSQYYAQMFPEIFLSQTSWIVENREALNIAFVVHLGDIVQLGAAEAEWLNADEAMSLLEDPARTLWPDGIPYGFTVGNHDQAPNNNAGTIDDDDATTENFNRFFGVPRYESRSYFGGHYSTNNDNSYQLFSAGGMDFVSLNLEYDGEEHALRDDVIVWADQVLTQHGDRRAIVSSHSLLCTYPGWPNATQCPETIFAPFSGQGQAIYDSLKVNPNLFLMLCGHAAISSYQPRRTDVFDGNAVHTLLANYQRGEPCPFRCGNGWLRILTFSPANDEIRAETYSPWFGKFWDGLNQEHHSFVLPYDMNGGRHFEQIGGVDGVASGMTACLDWTGRSQGSTYEWYAEVTDTEATVGSTRWTFGSDGSCSLEADCDDADPCTIDSCLATTCEHSPIADCCQSSADCDDGNSCTDDACVTQLCSHTYNTRACYDGSECTENDTCVDGACVGTPLQCGDGNSCTTDTCVDGACVNEYTPVGTCCSGDTDCDDGNYCTVDSCNVDGACTNDIDPSCCNSDTDCSDGDSCTNDICIQRNVAALRLGELYGQLVVPNFQVSGVAGGELGQPQPPSLNARRFTIECWFKWDGGGIVAATSGFPWDPRDVGGIEAYPLISKGVVDQEIFPNNPVLEGKKSVNYFLGISEVDHVLAADFEEHPTGASMSANHPVYGTTELLPNLWYHAAATYDGQCWQLYLNGNPETDGTNCPAQPPAYETEHFFGVGVGKGWEGISEGSFLGLIDEVRIWGRALEQAEIASNMQLRVESAPDLLARFGFDSPGAAGEYDTSGNSNHGVIVNADYELFDLVQLGQPQCESRSPDEIMTLTMYRSDPTRLRWVDPRSGFSYDVVAGKLAQLERWGAGPAVCLGNALSETAHLDYRMPLPGEGFYYLIREDAPCGAGTYGFDSSGAERIVDTWDCQVGD